MKTSLLAAVQNTLPDRQLWQVRRSLLQVSAVVLLAACSSAPEAPAAELQAAEIAISNAERAQVIRYTGTELNTARSELAAAHAAVTANEMPQARRLALQSQLNAELAIARAQLHKARTVNQDMLQSIEALQQETQHNLQEPHHENN